MLRNLRDLSPCNEAVGKEGAKLHSITGQFRASVAAVHKVDAADPYVLHMAMVMPMKVAVSEPQWRWTVAPVCTPRLVPVLPTIADLLAQSRGS